MIYTAAMVSRGEQKEYLEYSLNDLPMFEVADEGIGVSNARPEILQAADQIIGSNEDDAVAKYIQSVEFDGLGD